MFRRAFKPKITWTECPAPKPKICCACPGSRTSPPVQGLHLDDHLSNTLSTQNLAALEILVLERREQVEETGEQEEDGRHNQAGRSAHETDPLNDAHDEVHDDARPVLLKTAEEAAEALRPDGEL